MDSNKKGHFYKRFKRVVIFLIVFMMIFGDDSITQFFPDITYVNVSAADEAVINTGSDNSMVNNDQNGQDGTGSRTESQCSTDGGADKETGKTAVSDEKASSDISGNGTNAKTPENTTVSDGSTDTAVSINITKIVMPENTAVIHGADTAAVSSDYVFTVEPEENYVTDRVTVNDTQINPDSTDNGTGTYTVKSVSTDLTIKAYMHDTLDDIITLSADAGGKYDVSITGTRRAFGKAASMSADILTDSEIDDVLEQADKDTENADVQVGFDIKLLDNDGSEVEPDGEVSVSFSDIIGKAVQESRTDDLQILHVTDDDSETIIPEVDGKDVTLDTDHFSAYVFMYAPNSKTTCTVTGTIDWTAS